MLQDKRAHATVGVYDALALLVLVQRRADRCIRERAIPQQQLGQEVRHALALRADQRRRRYLRHQDF